MSEKIISKLKKKLEILEDMVESKTRDLFLAKEEVERTSNFIKTVIDSMNEMILSIDETGNIKLANNAAKSKLKFDDELLNKNIRSVLGDSIVDFLIENNDVEEQVEVLIEGKNKSEFPAFIARESFKEKDSDEDSYVYSIIDITNLKKKESIIEKQRVQLVQNTQLASLGEMASGIAHEINNPVTVMEGQLRRLKDYLADDDILVNEKIELTEKVQANLKRVVNIVAGIRKISRKGEDDNIAAIKVSEVINSLINLCSEKFRNSEVDIRCEGSKENIFVMAKETQLLQVLMNLVTNSSDAICNNDKKWILVQVDATEDLCKFRIVDSGNGIDNNILKKMFNPFFTTKDIGKGTGIGLSISKQMIEDQGGSLSYELFNNNTSFVITLKKAI